MLNILLSVLSGIFLSVSLPNFYIPFAFLIGYFLFFHLIKSSNNYKDVLFYSFIAGFSFSLLSFYWIVYAVNYYGGINIYLSLFMLVVFAFMYSILYFASFGIMGKFILNNYGINGVFLFPFIWVFIEVIREFFPFGGFPWNLSGYMISYVGDIINLASVFSVYGLSFVVILLSVLIFYSIQKKGFITLGLFFLLWLFVIFYPSRNSLELEDYEYKIAIIQGNITEDIKQNKNFSKQIIDKYVGLFEKAYKKNVDLIILSESALPFFYFTESKYKDYFFEKIKPFKVPFITGLDNAIYINGKWKLYNSLFMFDENHNLVSFYNKVKIVPFGEYVPKPFKIFENVFEYLQGYDFSFGKIITPIEFNKLKIGSLICFEAIFPNFVYAFVKKGSNVLVNITNDGWFGKTSAPFQHFEMARVRAVETNRYLIRAANTGISAVISPNGNIITSSKLFDTQILISKINIINENSFWVSFRNYIIVLFFSLFLITFLIVIFFRKK